MTIEGFCPAQRHIRLFLELWIDETVLRIFLPCTCGKLLQKAPHRYKAVVSLRRCLASLPSQFVPPTDVLPHHATTTMFLPSTFPLPPTPLYIAFGPHPQTQHCTNTSPARGSPARLRNCRPRSAQGTPSCIRHFRPSSNGPWGLGFSL